MKDRLDRGLLGICHDPRGKECLVDREVAHLLGGEQRDERVKAAFGNAGLTERGEVGTRGFHHKGAVRQAGGGVAFAEDGELALFASQLVGKLEHAGERITG